MKFLHLSDLHIGKKLNGFNLIEDQKHILSQTLEIIDQNDVDGIIIAGDVYDSSLPPSEAVMLLDYYLTALLKRDKQVFIVSGNHDSPERLAFCSDILKADGLHIEAIFKGRLGHVRMDDEYGPINVYMLPFIKPAHVKAYFSDSVIESYTDAVKLVIDNQAINMNERNIIIAHQFVTKAGAVSEMSESEVCGVGGLDNVNFAVFDGYDYAALGHLHAPQTVGRDAVVYGGSPLKYSISERFQKKGAVLATLNEKGSVLIEKIPLSPLRDVRQIKGPFDTLIAQNESNDYISVILTDKTRHLEPYKRLRAVYKNCISIAYEGELESGETDGGMTVSGELSQKDHMQIFEEFFCNQNGEPLDSFSKEYVVSLLDMEDSEI